MSSVATTSWSQRWQRFAAAAMRFFHTYASWLVSISWKRFLVLSVLLVVCAAILKSLPPFSWTMTETITDSGPTPTQPAAPPKAPKAPEAPRQPVIKIERAKPGTPKEGVDISIDERGIRITPRAPAQAGSAASAPVPAAVASGAAAASAAASAAQAATPVIDIRLPEGLDEPAREAVREAVQAAREQVQEALETQRQAAQDAAEAQRDAEEALAEMKRERSSGQRVRVVAWGDFLTDLAMLWVMASAIVKATYKGRIQAEVKAAQATETAEAESLKRQVVEARMAAMQAQVEPHFLFNTLASIDHLIETDPPRASQMQKNLIALLRASMPSMREAGDGAERDLGRELQVIRPYLEILKVRMEERLSTEIAVSDGLMSAQFPPMMIQTLVENAVKHGLEPKAEGGHLRVSAEIVHGKLAVSVADTGLGFGRAATAGTGVGLANIRERLALLYGPKATLTLTENTPSGTVATITVPYRSLEEQRA